MGWSAVGIGVFFLGALCLSWLSHEKVHVVGQSDPGHNPQDLDSFEDAEAYNEIDGAWADQVNNDDSKFIPEIKKEHVRAFARKIADKLHQIRHQDELLKIWERLGEDDLSDEEKKLDKGMRDAFQTGDSLRRYLIRYIVNGHSYETIAVAMSHKKRLIVIAGNVKTFDIWQTAGHNFTDERTNGTKFRITHEQIRDFGFRGGRSHHPKSDASQIVDIIMQEYPHYRITIIEPSEGDREKFAQQIRLFDKGRHTGPNEERQQARYPALLQIQSYFTKHKGGSIPDDTIVEASRPFCATCWDDMIQKGIDLVGMEGSEASKLRWLQPEEPNIIYNDIPHAPAEISVETYNDTLKFIRMLSESGGVCFAKDHGGVCRSFQDFTHINAEELYKALEKLPAEARGGLLSSLDKVGMEKLKGDSSAKEGIYNEWKNWKVSLTRSLMADVGNKSIMSSLFLEGNKSYELEKVAISPTILADSYKQLQTDELEHFAKKYEEFKALPRESASEYRSMVWKAVGVGFAVDSLAPEVIEVWGLQTLSDVMYVNRPSGIMNSLRQFQWFQKAEKFVERFRKFAKFLGGAMAIYGIHNFISNIKKLEELEAFCSRNDSIFKAQVATDCFFDYNIEVMNTVSTAVGIVTGGVEVAVEILEFLGFATGFTGGLAAIRDLYLLVQFQLLITILIWADIATKIPDVTLGEVLGYEVTSILNLPPTNLQLALAAKTSFDYDIAVMNKQLDEFKDFQTYVAPTTHTRDHIDCNCPSKFVQQYEDDSQADFTTTNTATLHCMFRIFLEAPEGKELECVPNRHCMVKDPTDPPDSDDSLSQTYLCHKVIALSDPSRSNQTVLINLMNGTDFAVGFDHRKNYFLVGNGTKTFIGGLLDDFFLLNSTSVNGTLDGGAGKNTLQLIYKSKGDSLLEYDMTRREQESTSYGDLLISNVNAKELILRNIQQILGRRDAGDIFKTACSTTYMNLDGGGSNHDLDVVIIPPLDCDNVTTTMKIRQFTTVRMNHEGGGNLTYVVDPGPSVTVELNGPTKSINQFFLSNDTFRSHISFQDGELVVTNETGIIFTVKNFQPLSKNFTLMTQAGLWIKFDDKDASVYGLAALSRERKTIKGLTQHPNLMYLTGSDKIWELTILTADGGEKDDIFIFTGKDKVAGTAYGFGGVNTLVFQSDFIPKLILGIDMEKQLFWCKSEESTAALANSKVEADVESNGRKKKTPCLSGHAEPMYFFMTNIQKVVGRPGLSDHIQTNCDTKLVDLRGGSQEADDYIWIPPLNDCKFNMTIILRNFTTVENQAMHGDFTYVVDVDGAMTGASQANFISNNEHNSEATHKFYFNLTSSSLTQITHRNDKLTLGFQKKGDLYSLDILARNLTAHFSDEVYVKFLPAIPAVVNVDSNSTVQQPGLQDHPNIFLLWAATKDSKCSGGDKNDTFALQTDKFYGQISGGDGKDAIILADDIWNGQPVIIDGMSNSISVNTGHGIEYKFGFSEIEKFFGRVGQSDVVYPGCDTRMVDTRVGSNGSTFDLVRVSSSLDCYFDLDVAIRPNLVVINDATQGKFLYDGAFEGGKTSIFLTFTAATEHNVALAMDFMDLKRLNIDQGRVNMEARDDSQFSVDYFIPRDKQTQTQPSIAFQDGFYLKVSNSQDAGSAVFGALRNLSSSDKAELDKDIGSSSLIQMYQKTAKDTGTNVVMEVKTGTLVSIGSGGRHDTLMSVSGYETNVLIQNNANQTVFQIGKGTVDVLILTEPKSEGHKVLDLTEIVQRDPKAVPTLSKDDKDVTIRVKNVEIKIPGLADKNHGDWASWDVLLRELHLNIEEDSENSHRLKLVPNDILVEPKSHDTLVMDAANLEKGLKIRTLSDPAPIVYERLKDGDDLVFTNLFQKKGSQEVATVVLTNFYKQTKQTLKTKQVKFEVKPGYFIDLTEDAGRDVQTFEERAAGAPVAPKKKKPTVSKKDEL